MKFESHLRALARFPNALRAALDLFEQPDLAWAPDEESWTACEIVGHLADEETDDFRPRLLSTLEDPSRAWKPIDPAATIAKRRKKKPREARDELARFETERVRSLELLPQLADARWETAHEHPKLGVLRAGDLLLSWRQHDLLHLRQLLRLAHGLASRDAAGFDGAYAGAW